MKVNLQIGSSIFRLRRIRMEDGTVFSINWSSDCVGGTYIYITRCNHGSEMANEINIVLKPSDLAERKMGESAFLRPIWWGMSRLQNLTSTPRASSISLFSLSPGPMCLTEKSSCRGNILSICLEEEEEEEAAAAVVLRPRAVVRKDAPLFPIPDWSFQTTRLLSLRRLHGAPALTDLAKKIPQDLAQLCISKSLCENKCAETRGEPLFVCVVVHPHWDYWCDPCRRLCQLLQTAEFQRLHRCTSADQSERRSCCDAVTSPGQTAAELPPLACLRRGRQDV